MSYLSHSIKRSALAVRRFLSGAAGKIILISAAAALVLLVAVAALRANAPAPDPPAVDTDPYGTTDTETGPGSDPERFSGTGEISLPEAGDDTPADVNGEIDAVIARLASEGFDENAWAYLSAFGDAAYKRCLELRIRPLAEMTGRMTAVVSIFASRYIKDEAISTGLLSEKDFYDSDGVEFDFGNYNVNRFSFLKTNAQSYGRKHTIYDITENYPHLKIFLDAISFDSYYFDPAAEDLQSFFEHLVKTPDPSATSYYLANRREETIDYIAGHYAGDTDPKLRAAMDTVLWGIVGQNAGWIYSMTGSAMPYGSVNNYLEEYLDYVRSNLGSFYEDEIKEYVPDTYRLLSKLGISGYKTGEPGYAERSYEAISALLDLYSAVNYGFVKTDGPRHIYVYDHEYYEDDETHFTVSPYPDGLDEKVREYYGGRYEDYYPELTSPQSGMDTPDGFKAYFRQFMTDGIVDGLFRENANFLIFKGKIYCRDVYDPRIGLFSHSARVLKEYEGGAVIAFKTINYYTNDTREYTVNVSDTPSGIKITGGTFVEILPDGSDSVGKGSVADAIQAVLLMHEVYFNGTPIVGYECFESKPVYLNSPDDAPENLKNAVKQLSADYFPVYYMASGVGTVWRDCMHNRYVEKIDNDWDSLPYRRGFLIPSLAGERNEPAFCEPDDITVYNVYENMKIIEKTDKSMTVSLDFIHYDKGSDQGTPRTYTFEFSISDAYGGFRGLTGGTFLDEVIMNR